MIEIKSKNEIYVDKRNWNPRAALLMVGRSEIGRKSQAQILRLWIHVKKIRFQMGAYSTDLIFVDENEIIYPRPT